MRHVVTRWHWYRRDFHDNPLDPATIRVDSPDRHACAHVSHRDWSYGCVDASCSGKANRTHARLRRNLLQLAVIRRRRVTLPRHWRAAALHTHVAGRAAHISRTTTLFTARFCAPSLMTHQSRETAPVGIAPSSCFQFALTFGNRIRRRLAVVWIHRPISFRSLACIFCRGAV